MDKNLGLTNPDHYKRGRKESIDMMVEYFGREWTMAFCRLNAFKYHCRKGSKIYDGMTRAESMKQDECKAAWYTMMARHLENSEPYHDPRHGLEDWAFVEASEQHADVIDMCGEDTQELLS